MNSADAVNERSLLNALGDAATSREQIHGLMTQLKSEERFHLNHEWLELALNESLPAWRRLVAVQCILDRYMTYPCPKQVFEREVLVPMRIDDSQVLDMTIAQALPIERNHGEVIHMALLPIPTPAGSAAIYLALQRETENVLRAAVSPKAEDLEEKS